MVRSIWLAIRWYLPSLGLLTVLIALATAHAAPNRPLETTAGPVAQVPPTITGTWTVTSTQATFVDQFTRTVTTTIWYPTGFKAGGPVPLTQTFPVIVVGQGGDVDGARYNWLAGLAEFGFIVAIPNAPPAQFTIAPGVVITSVVTGVDILNRANTLVQSLNVSATSPLTGRVAAQFGLVGHSQGGFASYAAANPQFFCSPFLAAFSGCPTGYTTPTTLRAIATLGASLAGTGVNFAPQRGPFDGFPVFLIGGTRDGLATPTNMALTYRAFANSPLTPTTSVTYYNLPGATHFGWSNGVLPPGQETNANVGRDNPNSPESGTPITGTLTVSQQQVATNAALAAFFNCVIKGQTSQCAAIPVSTFATPLQPGQRFPAYAIWYWIPQTARNTVIFPPPSP